MSKIAPIKIRDVNPHLCFVKIHSNIERTFLIAQNILYIRHNVDNSKIWQLAELEIQEAIISADSSWIAVLTFDHKIRVFETLNGLEKFTISAAILRKSISMVFSNDNSQLICALDDILFLHVYQLQRAIRGITEITFPQNLCPIPAPVVKICFSDRTLIAISKINEILSIEWGSTLVPHPIGTRLPLAYHHLYQPPKIEPPAPNPMPLLLPILIMTTAHSIRILPQPLPRRVSQPLIAPPPTSHNSMLFHRGVFLICALSSGHVICFNTKNYRQFIVLNFVLVDHIDEYDYGFTNEQEQLIVSFSNFSKNTVVFWEFTILKDGTIRYTILPLYFVLNHEVTAALRFRQVDAFKIDNSSYEGKIPTSTHVYCSDNAWQFSAAEYDFRINKIKQPSTPELAGMRQSPDDFYRFPFGLILASLKILTNDSTPIKIVLQHYIEGLDFKLKQIYIKKIDLYAGKVRLCVWLSDSMQENIIELIEDGGVCRKSKNIYAEFSLFNVSFQIDEYLDASTYLALMKMSTEQIRKYRLLLPKTMHRALAAQIDLAPSIPLLWPSN